MDGVRYRYQYYFIFREVLMACQWGVMIMIYFSTGELSYGCDVRYGIGIGML